MATANPNQATKDEGEYKTNKKEGLWREWIAFNGILMAATEEGVYQDGKRNGVWKTLFNGHVVERGTYNNGKKVGEWYTWDEVDGRVLRKWAYQDGQLEGEYIDYYGDVAQKAIQGMMHNGKREGEWHMWHRNGVLAFTSLYHNDNCVK